MISPQTKLINYHIFHISYSYLFTLPETLFLCISFILWSNKWTLYFLFVYIRKILNTTNFWTRSGYLDFRFSLTASVFSLGFSSIIYFRRPLSLRFAKGRAVPLVFQMDRPCSSSFFNSLFFLLIERLDRYKLFDILRNFHLIIDFLSRTCQNKYKKRRGYFLLYNFTVESSKVGFGFSLKRNGVSQMGPCAHNHVAGISRRTRILWP